MPDPSSTYTVTGGARIGLVNYTWPLAKLMVTADRLTVNTSMFGLFGMGTYSFAKDQVLSIERYGWIPLIGEGIRINHSVADYPERIVFWCQPNTVLAGLAATGFVPACPASQMPERQSPRGFPLRWTPLIVLVVTWNLLFGFEMIAHAYASPSPRWLTLVAYWMLFGVSIAAIRFPNFQKLFMKPGRRFEEVKPVFFLVATISGIMSFVFAIIFALGGVHSKPKAKKASLLTPDPPPASAVMTATTSTPCSTLAPGQA